MRMAKKNRCFFSPSPCIHHNAMCWENSCKSEPQKKHVHLGESFCFKLLLGYSRPRDVPSILFLQDGLPDASFVSCRMNQAFFTKFFRLHMASHKDHELLNLGKWWFCGHKHPKKCVQHWWCGIDVYCILYSVLCLNSIFTTLHTIALVDS